MDLIKSLLIIATLSGCATYKNIEPYPDTWPQPKAIERNSCPDISGQYGFMEAHPAMDFSSKRSLNFLNDLAGHHAPTHTPNKVILSNEGDKWFRIQTFEDTILGSTQSYTNQNSEIFCSQDGLIVKPPSYKQTEAGGIGRVWSEYTFNLAEDGSLIFKMKSTGAGMVLYISPAIAKETTWHRLKRIGE
jgi:hypothetical protein